MDLGALHARDDDQMRWTQEPHRARERPASCGIIQIGEHNDKTTMFQERPDGERGAHRIRLGRFHIQARERAVQARNRTEAAFRCAHGERPLGKHDEPHAIIVWRCNLRKARRDIRIQAETIQASCTHAAEAARIKRNENIQMLILTELARDELATPRRRLPVDARERIARRVGTQLMELRARSQSASRPQPRAMTARSRAREPHGLGRDIDCPRDGKLARPPGEPRRAQTPNRQRRPQLWS